MFKPYLKEKCLSIKHCLVTKVDTLFDCDKIWIIVFAAFVIFSDDFCSLSLELLIMIWIQFPGNMMAFYLLIKILLAEIAISTIIGLLKIYKKLFKFNLF